MVLAGIIAAIAILTNNPVLVVGAMIVSPTTGRWPRCRWPW
jgi:uncharacterized membrane protein